MALHCFQKRVYTPDRRQSKTLLTIEEQDKKWLETVLLFLTIFDLHSSIVLTLFIAAYPV